MTRILIVEDELPISKMLNLSLTKAGYNCCCAYTGNEALHMVSEYSPDLILLDVMLPEIDGFEVMEYIAPLKIPVIFITAKDTVNDRVKGLKIGAEDYIIKPFEVLELLARIEVVLRRYGKLTNLIEIGGIKIDTNTMQVTDAGGQAVILTHKEYQLLLFFATNPNLVLHREVIYERVWGSDYPCESRTLELQVQRMRKKVGWTEVLKTIPKVGYRLEV